MKRRLAALFLLTLGLAAAGAGVGSTAKAPAATASAYAITIVVPGQPGAVSAVATVPGTGTTGAADSFVYPADGSVVRTGAQSSSVAAQRVGTQSVTDVLGVSLFNGEITIESVAGRARAVEAGGNAAGSALVGLVLGGTPITATANQRLTLGEWGTAIALEESTEVTESAETRDVRVSINALHITLLAEHGGLPAGSEIMIGHADTTLSVRRPSETRTTPVLPGRRPPTPSGVPGPRKPLPKPSEPTSTPGIPGKLFRKPPKDVTAPLSPGGYVFPVYGQSSFSDTFGAPRADVSWHHGQDIFAQLGTPLLAVADGTVFSVGWNNIGGYRFWLRDRAGNQFYYAHLSAFSPLAVDGNDVKAGAVIGFMGNTGDAQGTPYHVHFEIHPVSLLPMGYDGVVNPFPYLSAWRRLTDVSFAAGRGWAPPVPASASAPKPGAFLIGSTDISSASGLEPGGLERALVAPVSAEGDGALLRTG